TAKYGRSGATMEGMFAVLKFQSWSLWSFDAAKGTMKRLTKLYAEEVDDLKKEAVGLPGKLGTFTGYDLGHHVACSPRAGVVALSLNAQTVFTFKEDVLKPAVLLRVPKW